MFNSEQNSNLSKANYLYSDVYKSDTQAQARTVFENVNATKVTITQTGGGSTTEGYVTVQGADDADFTQNAVSIGEVKATGNIVERDISNYKYIRVIAIRVANGTNKLYITFS